MIASPIAARTATGSFLAALALLCASCTADVSRDVADAKDGPAKSGSRGDGSEMNDAGSKVVGTIDLDAASSVGRSKVTPAKRNGLAFGWSKVLDPRSDSQTGGTAPPLGEIERGYVRGLGSQVELILDLAGEIPQRFDDDSTYLLIAWNIAGSKEHPSVGISAQSHADGWSISAARNERIVRRFRGTLTADGDRAILTLPWKALGGPHSFKWSAASTFSSTAEGSTGASADNIPNARFPSPHRDQA